MKNHKPYYPVLEAEISKQGLRKKDIAQEMGITPRSLSQKMSGKSDWWWNEILFIHSIFPDKPPLELFKHS